MNQMLFSLPASLETYQGLGNFIFTHGLTREMYEIVDEAISAWMQGFLAAKSEQSAKTLDGYQWKDVFLPNGCTLRNVYKRISYLAHVKGSNLQYGGRNVSPTQFVNQVGGSYRNAWKTIWVRFPNEDEWKPAFALRKESPRNKSEKGRIRQNKSD